MSTIEPAGKIAVEPFVPVTITTQRLDRTDSLGQVIGYSLVSTSEWGSWVDHYDLADRLVGGRYEDGHGYTSEWSQRLDSLGSVIESRFDSSDGSWEAATRVEPPAVLPGPHGISHALSTTGFWPGFGTYTRLEVFDLNGHRIYSTASYADGSSELYELAPVLAEDGRVTGYSGTWTWTSSDGVPSSWSEALDLNLVPVWSMVDDGIMPMVQEMAAAKAQPFGSGVAFQPLVSDSDSLNLGTPEYEQRTHAILTGSRNLDLRGNALDNVLVGNAGRNRIHGGRGSDQVTGGEGEDLFVVRPARDDLDTITDFDPGLDQLVLKGRRLQALFLDGELRNGVLGAVLRFDRATDTLLFSPGEDSDGESSIPLAVLPGLRARQLSDPLFVAG